LRPIEPLRRDPVRPLQYQRGSMRGEVMQSSRIDDRTVEALAVQGRARVSWGHDPEAIRWQLMRDGLERSAADAVVEDALERRDRHFRRRGFVDLLVAAVGVVILASLCVGVRDGHRPRARMRPPGGALTIVALYTTYRLYRGASRLMFGGKGSLIPKTRCAFAAVIRASSSGSIPRARATISQVAPTCAGSQRLPRCGAGAM
jgi:hypothetical protein